MAKLPGGELPTRPLHLIWICDCSGSMQGDKIQSLNIAIREAVPHLQQVAEDNPNANVVIRALKFSDRAQWHISQPTPVADFQWVDLSADRVGDRNMGAALSIVADELNIPPMEELGLPPLLVLVTDGHPTDDFGGGLKALMDQPWGKKAVRVAIAIGQDADREVLERFIDHPELKPLEANNPEALVNHIKWISTAASGFSGSDGGSSEAGEVW